MCCGGLRTDYIITARGETRLMEMGGNALYAAAGAKVWLERVAILARIGESYPLGWLDDLRAYGFDVRGIRRVPGPQDHRTFYAYLDENTRVDTEPAKHFARLGFELPAALRDYVHSTPGQDDPHRYEPLAFTPEDFELYFTVQRDTPDSPLPTAHSTETSGVECRKSAVGLHIAPSSIRTQRYLPEAARRYGVRVVSADPGERAMQPALMPYVEEMLAQVDIFLPSDQEAESLFRDEPAEMDARRCAEWFANRGPSVVVLKLGADGALVHERGSGRFWHVPALPVRVVDVTGAGDAFCGGFMADFIKHGDPVRAAIAGSVSASFAVQDYGPRAILGATREEINSRTAWLRERITAV
ncbi:MAG: PfkB family carbohydrate kinase [Anaerolineae bacterium]|nr:PfkB family carbohydrate kinase [Candidatus Roseilinea sp.]MDW8450401.1 PfkB family carbohydrate kinase [Anaerolineae bacterium]